MWNITNLGTDKTKTTVKQTIRKKMRKTKLKQTDEHNTKYIMCRKRSVFVCVFVQMQRSHTYHKFTSVTRFIRVRIRCTTRAKFEKKEESKAIKWILNKIIIISHRCDWNFCDIYLSSLDAYGRLRTIKSLRSFLLCYANACFAALHVYRTRIQRIHTHRFTHRLTDWLTDPTIFDCILIWRWLQITWNASWPKVMRPVVFRSHSGIWCLCSVANSAFTGVLFALRIVWILNFAVCTMHTNYVRVAFSFLFFFVQKITFKTQIRFVYIILLHSRLSWRFFVLFFQ